MIIAGEWRVGDDAKSRPIIRGRVLGSDGLLHTEQFLVDSGADATVFSAAFLRRIKLSSSPLPSGTAVIGVGGASPAVVVSTTLLLLRQDGNSASVRGEFVALTDAAMGDLSVLGRDVQAHFHVVLSEQLGEVLLLAPPHRYAVVMGK